MLKKTVYRKNIEFRAKADIMGLPEAKGGEKMKVSVQLDEKYTEPQALILTNKITEEINRVAGLISDSSPQFILGFRSGKLTPLDEDCITRIYSAAGKVFTVVGNEEFTLKARLYELEERLDKKKFIRISNSEIVNFGKVKNFDLSLAGTITVIFKDGSKTYVSRRYVKKIKQFLGI